MTEYFDIPQTQVQVITYQDILATMSDRMILLFAVTGAVLLMFSIYTLYFENRDNKLSQHATGFFQGLGVILGIFKIAIAFI